MDAVCLSLVTLLTSLNLSAVPIPSFNASFMGVHAFNLTCSDIVLGASGADWVTNTSVATTTNGGYLHCTAHLTAYAYTGLVHADITVDRSSVVLSPAPLTPGEEDTYRCLGRPYVVDDCTVAATITALRADPPSRLVDMALEKMQSTFNENIATYTCNVLVPQMQESMTHITRDFQPVRNSSASKTVHPLYDAPLVEAAARIFRAIVQGDKAGDSSAFYVLEESVVVSFPIRAGHLRFAHSLVAAAAAETSVDWLQGVVDNVLAGVAPEPFPVYGLPGEVENFSVNYEVPSNKSIFYWMSAVRVDATVASCDGNACDLYLNPGVVVDAQTSATDAVSALISNLVLPQVLQGVNAKISDVLRTLAVAQHCDMTDPNATVRLAFGKKAVVRRVPRLWPLAAILVCGVVGGSAMVRRNVRRHAAEPVLHCATGEPVSVVRLMCEDVVMVVVATACLLLFAASNTMTGASVLLGDTLNSYSFSMWNTVTDLWGAGLIPLSLCVLVFSGVYPYVKLLSLVYFTVWAQRPLSRRLALIDVLGKFSFIDTFALMVMVSGLEIRSVAKVVIHPAFYLFMFATVASIALGNYATTLYRRDTSHRVEDDAAAAGGGAYAHVATTDGATVPPSPPPPPPPLHDSEAAGDARTDTSSSSLLLRVGRRLLSRVSVLPFLVVLLCSLPSWKAGCLTYTIGGLARVVTPVEKTLSLWQLSLLDKWGELQSEDAMIVSIFVVAICTVLLAPCLFALLSRQCTFLASWCAADVFVIACVAGLLQLHQFVTFVLGEGMDDVYTAHATLRWPMLPLTVASLVVLAMIAREVFGVTWPPKQPTASL